jgi:hypothetical protein
VVPVEGFGNGDIKVIKFYIVDIAGERTFPLLAWDDVHNCWVSLCFDSNMY